MTTKIRAIIAGFVSAISGFIAWLLIVPPEQQQGLLGQLVQICPVSWQANAALCFKAVTTISGIYMVYKAAHSGPQSPPKNPPTE